ncbi:MAG: hypothetical protein RJB09_1009 [Pseudomonadota bacterium]
MIWKRPLAERRDVILRRSELDELVVWIDPIIKEGFMILRRVIATKHIYIFGELRRSSLSSL